MRCSARSRISRSSTWRPTSCPTTSTTPLQHVGPDKAAIQKWFDTWEGPIGWAIGDLTVEVGGEVAFAYGLGHMTGTKKGGDKADVWTRVTVGFVRRGGVWTITHQHNSVPFLMDGSFKAAVDSTP